MTLDNSTGCGLSLKHATIIIGIISSILSFMSMCLSSSYVQHPTEIIEITNSTEVIGKDALKTLLILCSIISGLKCIFSIMIIFGAETNRPKLLVPWLIYSPVLMMLYIIATVTRLVHQSTTDTAEFVIGNLIFASVFSCIGVWIYSIVYRLFKFQKSLNF